MTAFLGLSKGQIGTGPCCPSLATRIVPDDAVARRCSQHHLQQQALCLCIRCLTLASGCSEGTATLSMRCTCHFRELIQVHSIHTAWLHNRATCRHVQVCMEDFEEALKEVKPAFGAVTEALEAYRLNGIIDYGEQFRHLLSVCKQLVEQASLLSLLTSAMLALKVNPAVMYQLIFWLDC